MDPREDASLASSLYDATRAVARKSGQQHQRNSNGPAMGFFVIFASRLIASAPQRKQEQDRRGLADIS
jgi:hypothetical protein